MVITHSLGFPRIGSRRQMKFAVEAYWKGEIDAETLIEKGQQIRRENWEMQERTTNPSGKLGDAISDGFEFITRR